ncbi:hypothetical protein [Anaerosporobacter sp.]|uniref:hypothetical protein n=1 Tax=Anaerosporobacter sp. TaxID=1872529 RepID=UPI00286F74AD|nr:hypothetical protein [Anaerosporobacter sp.]
MVINTDCPCKREKCDRHGNCEECKAHHRDSKSQPLTTCERLKRKEARKQVKE